MCRWFSYISSQEILLEDALVNPVHAITQQCRGDFQEENLLNADGFGVAWYTNTWSQFDESISGAHPVLYRTTSGKPLNDATFRFLCRSAASNVILSHLRGAFGAVASTNNHPFVFGRSTFMHNGFIMRFKDIRADMIKEMYRKYARMVGGSTDTEHFAALYFSYLDDQPHEGFFDEKTQKEKKFSALSMWKAMQHAVQKIEEIQLKHFGSKLNNTLNLCATNGESLVTLCYRTNPFAPPSTLYVSFTAGEELNRTAPTYNVDGDRRNAAALTKAANEFRNEVEDLKSMDIEERTIHNVIVASEPITFEAGDWYKVNSGQAILIDKDKTWNGDVEKSSLKVAMGDMPLARVSCVMHPDENKKQVIMFHNNLLAVIDVSKSDKTVLGCPVEIASTFNKAGTPPLPKLSSGVDAVIPNPKNKRQWHLFGGRKYLFVEVDTAGTVPSFSVLSGPSDISDVWGCLDIPKFRSVSAGLQVPGRENQAWFFSSNQYVRVSWTQNEKGNITGTTKMEGPVAIPTGWRSLDRADFDSVNMMLPHWNRKDHVLFFSGPNVALVHVNTSKDKPIDIPKGRRRPMSQDWPSCFYVPPNHPSVPSFNEMDEEDTALFDGIINPFNPNFVTFFSRDRFVEINVGSSPYSIVRGPLSISASFLGKAGDQPWCSGLDLVLPNPPKAGQIMHIFTADTCSAVMPYAITNDISTASISLKQGAGKIGERWTCLAEAGFKSVDAALEIPGLTPDGRNYVWFFSCNRYIRASWVQNADGSVTSMLEEKPREIADDWPALNEAKFHQVDMVLPKLGAAQANQNLAWFFYDQDYILVSVDANPQKTKIVEESKRIETGWPLLKCLLD